ncbi:tRNA (cytidine(32)/guanosine(34)-2'-O)-methyltransferase [Cladophialophora carrionii]|uniref:Putative tRNA (cytidine(32)/guanosine(34)-2'-O)-methyltransferase n=1 Tax=Cladophialophora carrionii TaxID=86049 RepID=A0A1C1CJ26_9EURO|nr:tRNA (cytidine(32)/guanosine(34)-2'-O)-methyltransferase [Cladophialophora carrionii]
MGKSSKDKRDAYYRLAKEQNWRARSAFKLIQIDEQFDLFSYAEPEKCTRVVDLCAAPGSWSQVLSRILIKGESFGRRAWCERMERFNRPQMAHLGQQPETDLVGDLNSLHLDGKPSERELKPRANVKIVAIDLQPMAPLEGIIQLQADITHPSTVPRLLHAIDPAFSPTDSTHLVDLVISDGAPDVTGLHSLDIYVQSQLLYSALTLATKVLRPGGKFVAKIFRGRNVDLIYAQLRILFERVSVAKPRASRASSIEAFVVCEGYRPVLVRSRAGEEVLWTPEIGDAPEPANGDISEQGGQDDTAAGEESRNEPTASGNSPEPVGARTQGQSRHRRPDGVVELHFPDEELDPARYIAPFLACGDLSAWDSDATYKLPAGHVSLDPVQPPTAPPYKMAIERRRIEGGMYGKTKKRDKLQSSDAG